MDVTSEAADFADDTLSGQSDHERRAMIALQRRTESPDQELVRLLLRPKLESRLQMGKLLLLLLKCRRVRRWRRRHAGWIVACHR